MLEYVGYLASVIVLISLLMSSVKKLRWINLFGSLTFVIYGLLIKAYPVAILNIGTVGINIYYLVKMSNQKTYFKILEIDKNSKYLEHFLLLHKNDLKNYFDVKDIDVDNAELAFYILRDIVPAGVFVGTKFDNQTLMIELDYVSPPYRDFSIGKYLYSQEKQIFLDKGYNKLITFTKNPVHMNYLRKMGFSKNEELDNDDLFCYQITL
ncbi:MAG: GNAT family N-acetyltransferase [Candidatus Izemoplasmatales bacterium]|nr:GNAT family N-acetyltransferase [Candidatus Izemoplasmatales bacterium]MDD4069559.1 GNAT family N-acetyltransferase [Candidatus Izemoplasmatales bacterium]MDY0139289.1 GNAT family N-acetyltransferase [Candidatus Izemoplasmatales bacterium]